MSKFELKPAALVIAALIVGAVVIILETLLLSPNDGTLLLTLAYFVTIVQGPVAVVAAAELSNGKWVIPVKKDLLAFYPLILLAAVMFPFMAAKTGIYPWTDHPTGWLNKSFFLTRNVIVLLLSYAAAFIYVRSTLRGSENRGKLAVVYLLFFITTQSFIAFDWIMPLEFPWISTMFGPLAFVESFYAGLALAAIIAALFIRTGVDESPAMRKTLRDISTFMLGFALFWAGLFYAQYLVIWYGNLPEETSYIVRRMSHSPYQELFYVNILLLFIIPFIGFMFKKTKVATGFVIGVSLIVLLGAFLVKVMYIMPDAHLNFLVTIISLVLLGILLFIFFSSREQFLKGSGAVNS